MKFKIYQINFDRDNEQQAFLPLDMINHGKRVPNSGIYDRVFEGTLDYNSLDDLFNGFNLKRPDGYHGRSLSISDVIAIYDPETRKDIFYFCDSRGFKEIEFCETDARICTSNLIRVVLVEPGKPAQISDVEPPIGGCSIAIGSKDIQVIFPFDEEVCIVCSSGRNEKSATYNRALRLNGVGEICDIISGPFFVCSCKGSKFSSLDAEQQQRFLNLYMWPERFLRYNETICAVKINPNEEINKNASIN